jgi:hypothetical protein
VEVDEAICEAITEGAAAGIFRKAARLDKKRAAAWDCHGDQHSERLAALLEQAMQRLGVRRPGPCSRGNR